VFPGPKEPVKSDIPEEDTKSTKRKKNTK